MVTNLDLKNIPNLVREHGDEDFPTTYVGGQATQPLEARRPIDFKSVKLHRSLETS